MKIGIMGGTFDPVHNGHLMLGKTAYKQFQLDEVWFMPNGQPPHKEQRSIKSDAATRTEMVSLAIEDVPGFRLEEYEVTKEGTCFSYETMEHFSICRPEDSFYFIIGADSLFSIETWAYPGRLLSTCTVLAACRDDIDTEEEMLVQIKYLRKKYNADIELLKAPLMHISSHNLREMICNGKSISGLIPKKVEEYIVKEGLYGS